MEINKQIAEIDTLPSLEEKISYLNTVMEKVISGVFPLKKAKVP